MTNPTEQLLARVTGVPKSTLAATRKQYLQKNVGWAVEDSVVIYTASGLQKILSIFGIAPAALKWPDAREIPPQTNEDLDGDEMSPDEEDDSPEPTARKPEAIVSKSEPVAAGGRVVKVVAIARNPTLLFVDLNGERVKVKVRDNRNFVIGMTFKVRGAPSGGDVFYFEGRLPRYKGRF